MLSMLSPRLRLPFVIANTESEFDAAVGCKHVVSGLFSGIGGLELGLSRSGHEAVLLCENDPSAMNVLRTHFSHVPLHDDIATLEAIPDSTSLIVAGFPCQDLSQAGMTRGITGTRSGLIDEVFRLIKLHRTRSVLLENVPFMLQLSRGVAMSTIASAFENLGYVWAYRVVDTRAFGLPQRRRRVYFFASRVDDPRAILFADEVAEVTESASDDQRVARGFYWTEGLRGLGWAVDAIPTLKGGSSIGIPSPPAILLTDGRVVTPDIRDAERLQGFRADWTKPAEEVGRSSLRWKLIGNAVSVCVAEWLGRRLAKPGMPLNFEALPLRENAQWPTAAWNVGTGRKAVIASEWPVQRPYCSLEGFLLYPGAALSAKATRGFLSRAERAKLRFPPNFLEALRRHLARFDETLDCAPG